MIKLGLAIISVLGVGVASWTSMAGPDPLYNAIVKTKASSSNCRQTGWAPAALWAVLKSDLSTMNIKERNAILIRMRRDPEIVDCLRDIRSALYESDPKYCDAAHYSDEKHKSYCEQINTSISTAIRELTPTVQEVEAKEADR
jgi:hypothetical protein